MPGNPTFTFRGAAGKAAPLEAVLARLSPLWEAERLAVAAALEDVLGERGALDAAAEQAAAAVAGAAAAVPAAPDGEGLVLAQKAYAAAAVGAAAATARRDAWDAAVGRAPGRQEAAGALAAAKASLAAGKASEALSRVGHARWLVERLCEAAKGVPAGGVAGAADLAGSYKRSMDLWLAPPLVKFALGGSQVRLDLAPDGSFALATNLPGRIVSTAGRWERRGEADDVSLTALVEDRAVWPAGRAS